MEATDEPSPAKTFKEGESAMPTRLGPSKQER